MPSPRCHLRTFTGREIDLFNLKIEDVCIEDIAHSLSGQNRFLGHTIFDFNVAVHSLRVWQYVCLQTTVPEIQLQALLHDAAEAYIGDMNKWLKETSEMEAYRTLESNVEFAIAARFAIAHKMHPLVAEADRFLVYAEGLLGFGPNFKIDHPAYTKPTKQQIDHYFGLHARFPLHMTRLQVKMEFVKQAKLLGTV